MREIKIAYIGGGSQQWALNLMSDLALQNQVTGELSLYDIDYDAALKNQSVSQSIFNKNRAINRFKVSVEKELSASLTGADFVIISVEPGDITQRFCDLVIPEQYGILQTVGDTVGPGGIARAIRSIPLMISFARAIEQHCPDAWVINYTNPMAWCTAALYRTFPGIKAVGCCHEVFHTQDMIADWVANTYQVERPLRHDIQLEIAGVNHFTFATHAYWQGKDLLAQLQQQRLPIDIARKNAQRRRDNEDWFSSDFQIALEFLRRYGVLGAAGDRHLAEFVPWFLTSEQELESWGVVRTPYAWRVKRTQTQDEARQKFLDGELVHSGEEGVDLLIALAGGQSIRTNVNLLNRGQNPYVPLGTLIECYGWVSHNRVDLMQCGVLPPAIQTVVDRNLVQQSLILDAVIQRNKKGLYAGLAMDPLVNLPGGELENMLDDMLSYLHINW